MSKKEKNIIYHSHDRAFRNAMSDLRVAQDIIKAYLPPDLTEKIEFNTLKLRPDTYIDEKLQKLVTDILYSVNLKDKRVNEPAFIYLLFEHLSNPRKLTPWDIFLYTCQIIQNNIKTDSDHLPIVIPVVVYNDSKKYSHSTSVFDLFADSQKELAKKYMFNNFHLIDFSQIPDDTMRQHKWSCVMEMLMKHAKRRDFMSVVERMKEGFRYLLEHDAKNYATGMLHYASQHTERTDEKRFQDFITTLSESTMEKKNMKLAEAWELRGYEKGVRDANEKAKENTMKFAEAEQRGYERGVREAKIEGIKEVAKTLLKTTTNLEFIHKVTGIDIKEIESLMSEIEMV